MVETGMRTLRMLHLNPKYNTYAERQRECRSSWGQFASAICAPA